MQINLNILTENNHSSLLSKNVPTADNALLQYMQKSRRARTMRTRKIKAAETAAYCKQIKARQKTDGAGDGISADELSG